MVCATVLQVSRDFARSFWNGFNQIWEQHSCSSGYLLKGFRSVPCAFGSIAIRFGSKILSVRYISDESPIHLRSTLDGSGSAWGTFMTLYGGMYGLCTVSTGFQSFRKVLSQAF